MDEKLSKWEPVHTGKPTGKCEYCGNETQLKKIRVKRPAPAGAKDLGLYDEKVHWHCSTCEATSTNGVSQCEECHKDGYPFLVWTHIMDNQIYRSCLDCVKCEYCEASIGMSDYMECSLSNSNNTYTDNNYTRYRYCHKLCFDKAIEADQMREKQEKEANRQRLKALGRCVECGSPLGLFDKMAGREAHTRCIS